MRSSRVSPSDWASNDGCSQTPISPSHSPPTQRKVHVASLNRHFTSDVSPIRRTTVLDGGDMSAQPTAVSSHRIDTSTRN